MCGFQCRTRAEPAGCSRLDRPGTRTTHTPLNVFSLHQLVPATFLKAQSFYFVNRKCVVLRFPPPFSPEASPRDLNSIYLNPSHVSFLMKTDQIHPVRSIPSSAPSAEVM